MDRPVQATGFTFLQDKTHPQLDIVFVHGLQGHPEKTWTDNSRRTEKVGRRSRLKSFFRRSSSRDGPSQSPSAAGGTFWPRDLLKHHESCHEARIMTYGYDSNIMKRGETANFTTITGEGETLLNGLARVRKQGMDRPLMFITHSLGGLIVKAALNGSCNSRSESRRDLAAVSRSTFAVIFFGTPHRGSGAAEFGASVAKMISLLTHKTYNKQIVRSLTAENEILTKLRKDFETTVDYMKGANGYQSSTFQEGKPMTDIREFSGKARTGE
ncbi:hypothetical protein CDD83_5723 [Cordyceps sp. RAO-2017]|nr:hypothetical protein CDD83_5723 [Cordyceps sp. RAO-2017]